MESSLAAVRDDPYRERALSRLQDALGPTVLKALSDPAIDEILLNCDGSLFVEERGGQLRPAGRMDAGAAAALVRTLASLSGRELKPAAPVFSGQMPVSGARFEGLLPPLVSAPSFAIRKHNALILSLSALVETGMLSAACADFLRAALLKRRSIVIAGGTGCGKTTLVNALLNELKELSPTERILTLEDTPELHVALENRLYLYTTAEADLALLLRSALRLRPDRIVVGEVRGAEALDLVDALSTGHSGGLTTVHAGSVGQALKRLVLLISRHPAAPRYIEDTLAEALDLIVLLTRHPQRHVAAVAAVKGYADGQFLIDYPLRAQDPARLLRDKEVL